MNDQLAWTSLRPAGSISIGLRPCDVRHPSLAGLVVLAGSLYPIPSRTRPSNFPAPMVLSLKTWKSRSLPGLPRTETSSRLRTHAMREPRTKRKAAAALPRRLFAFWADSFGHCLLSSLWPGKCIGVMGGPPPVHSACIVRGTTCDAHLPSPAHRSARNRMAARRKLHAASSARWRSLPAQRRPVIGRHGRSPPWCRTRLAGTPTPWRGSRASA